MGDANIRSQDPEAQKETIYVIRTQVYTNQGAPAFETPPSLLNPSTLVEGPRSSN